MGCCVVGAGQKNVVPTSRVEDEPCAYVRVSESGMVVGGLGGSGSGPVEHASKQGSAPYRSVLESFQETNILKKRPPTRRGPTTKSLGQTARRVTPADTPHRPRSLAHQPTRPRLFALA